MMSKLGMYVLFLFVILCLSVAIYICYPRYLSYTEFELAPTENVDSIPHAMYIEKQNLLLIKEVASFQPSFFHPFLNIRRSIMQVSGYGFCGNNIALFEYSTTEEIKGFYTYYDFLKVSPRIFFKDGNVIKTFFINKTDRNKFEILVDGSVFQRNNDNPLILLIREDGSVMKIESFESTFGINLHAFLLKPVPLSLSTVIVQPVSSDLQSPDSDLVIGEKTDDKH